MITEEASDDLIRWSALSEPGDRLAGAISRYRPDLLTGDLLRLTQPQVLVNELDDERFGGYLHSVPSLCERIAARLPSLRVSQLRAIANAHSAVPVAFDKLPDSLQHNFCRLGDSYPLLLWVFGCLDAFKPAPKVGFVGTRLPSSYSERVIRKSVTSFSTRFCVISGGALGVDSIAHRTALESRLPTVAFLAGGIDRQYPDSNKSLFAEIAASGGAVATEVVPGTAPTRWRFLQRNRLIAAACDMLVITEAGTRSGAKNTVHHANECGVRVLIVPGPIDSEISRGTNEMLAQHLGEPLLQPHSLEAAYLADGGAADFCASSQSNSPKPTLSSDAKRVLDAISGNATVFEIARESGLQSQVVSEQLSLLSGARFVAREGIYWVRLKHR